MNMRVRILSAVSALLGAICALLSVTCGEDPVGPRPTPKNYYFYGDDQGGRALLRFAPATGELDTVTDNLPRFSFQHVSANGQYIYMSLINSVAVYTADSFQHVTTLPYPSNYVAASPDGSNMAMFSNGRVQLLSLPDYQLIYSNDTLQFGAGVFTADSKAIYSIGGSDAGSVVMRLQIEPIVEFMQRPVPSMPGGIIQIVPSIDEKLWFLYSRWHSFGCSFGVYDVAADSIIYRKDLSPGGGWIVVSPDGRNVFFTNPGTLLVGTPPPSVFYIYDIPANAVKEISTKGLAADSARNGDDMPIGPIAISPDGKTLVAVRAVDGRDLIVFDVPSRTITNYHYFDWKAWFFDIKCQTGK